MKKYPFSNKAAKAIIAATIALTPVATTAVSLTSSSTVEASLAQAEWHFNTTTDLANYSAALQAQVNGNDDVNDVKIAFSNLLANKTDEQWKEMIQPILQEGTANDEEVDAAIALMKTFAQTFVTGITADEINRFIEQTDDNFGDASPREYLDYLMNAEAKLYAQYQIQTNDGQNDTANELFINALYALQAADDDSGKIKPKLQSTFYLADTNKVETASDNLLTALQEQPPYITLNKLRNASLAIGQAWEVLFNQSAPGGGGGGGGGGSTDGGGTVTPPPPGGNVVVSPVTVDNGTTVTATIPAALQTQILAYVTAETPEVVLSIPARTDGKPVAVELSGAFAAAVKGAAPSTNIVIDVGGTRYVLPLAQLDLAALSAGFGGDLSQLSLRVTIDTYTSTESAALLASIQASQNGTAAASSETKAAALVGNINMVATPAQVKVEAVAGSNAIEVKSFGDIYVEREFELNKSVSTNNTTGIAVGANGSFKALPTKFKTENGQQIAVVSSLTNDGVGTVIESNVTFPDVNNNKNWAEKYIETLASKFIISGTTAGTYKPDQDMTRAQFALLLSRALGLPGTTVYDGRFSDVKGNEWFNANGELMAAVKYGVVAGKANGTFAPDEKVTRAEAAAMIGRALELDFINFDESQLSSTKKLADFKDAKSIGASTRAEVLKVYQAGIMSGASNGNFNPNAYTKRDQMARILAEFLIKANLMENIK